MPRFFIENANEEEIVITGENAHHIGRSLRMRVGDKLTLCCEGVDYDCEITRFTDSEVFCSVVGTAPCESEPKTKLTLFQALPKGDKAELIVQKAVELGAGEVVFVMTERCVSRPDEKSFSKRLARLQKISLEAAKQCGRGTVPKISGLISESELLEGLPRFDKALMCYEKGGSALSAAGVEAGQRIALFIGSEGGFEEKEAAAFEAAGGELIGLGKRILRCETAPIAAISIIMSLAGEME